MKSVSRQILNLCVGKLTAVIGELDSGLLLGNGLFLSGKAERINGMESQNLGFGSRP
jgi:hypothetical protein